MRKKFQIRIMFATLVAVMAATSITLFSTLGMLKLSMIAKEKDYLKAEASYYAMTLALEYGMNEMPDMADDMDSMPTDMGEIPEDQMGNITAISDLIANAYVGEGSYAFMIDSNGNFLNHPYEAYQSVMDMSAENMANMASADASAFMDPSAGVSLESVAPGLLAQLQTGDVVTFTNYEGKECYAASYGVGSTGFLFTLVVPTSNIDDEFALVQKKCGLITILVDIIIMILAWFILKPIAGAMKCMARDAKRLAEGDLSVEIPASKRKDELGQLQNSLKSLVDNLAGMLKDVTGALALIADKDLTGENIREYKGDFIEMTTAVNGIKNILNDVIITIKQASIEVNQGAEQLSSAADSIAESSSQEAVSIQSLQESVATITDSINDSASNCEVVSEKIDELNRNVEQSNREMASLYEAVNEAERMSADIQKIVAAIDNIAFQTNILALNASVEAARAGEAGKGFAVVAEEVRNLAGRCAEESAKTSEYIGKCLEAVATAKNHADVAFGCLDTVVVNSEEIAGAFAQIASATEEEAAGASDIMGEIANISDGLQSNTATAEETAAATQELTAEAENMMALTQEFRTKEVYSTVSEQMEEKLPQEEE